MDPLPARCIACNQAARRVENGVEDDVCSDECARHALELDLLLLLLRRPHPGQGDE